MASIGLWLPRLLPGIVSALFFVIACDWLQTRVLNARRRAQNADDRIVDELPVAAAKVYLAALTISHDLGWLVYEADDGHYTFWAINRTPHLALRNIGLIVQMSPYGSGETRATIALNSPHPAWVRRRYRAAAHRFIERLRLRALDEGLEH
jgi:hypothetical protein